MKDVAAFSGDYEKLKGPIRQLHKKTQQTIKKVTTDIEERFHFNTAISAIMELVNTASKTEVDRADEVNNSVFRFALESMILLLSPIVPHFSEEIWRALGHTRNILLESWPEYQEAAMAEDDVLIVVQVNGKLRSKFNVGIAPLGWYRWS